MLRIIIFCDICNPLGVRYTEQKRNFLRGDIDGRSWFEGALEEALEWVGYVKMVKIFAKCRNRYNML